MLNINISMHRKPLVRLFILTLLAFADSRCTKHADGITGPPGPAGQTGASGTGVKSSPVTGYINLYDQYDNPFTSSGGVTVTILKGDSLLATTTDSTGKFALPPLPPGNYDIHATKTGFDSLEIYFVHSGGDEAKFLGITRMFQSVTTKITNETITLTPNTTFGPAVNLTTSFTGPPMTQTTLRTFWFFMSHSKNPTTKNYEYGSGQSGSTYSNQQTTTIYLSNINSGGKPYNSGDTVYVKTVVGGPIDGLSYWYDYPTDKSVLYPYYGDSTLTWFQYP